MSKEKVQFRIQNIDGYPGIDWESMWCDDIGNNQYKIDNIPMFVRDLSLGDIITAVRTDRGLEFRAKVKAGGNATVRIMTESEADIPRLTEVLRDQGCAVEKTHINQLITVNIPSTANSKSVREFLLKGFKDHEFEYEEANVFWPQAG